MGMGNIEDPFEGACTRTWYTGPATYCGFFGCPRLSRQIQVYQGGDSPDDCQYNVYTEYGCYFDMCAGFIDDVDPYGNGCPSSEDYYCRDVNNESVTYPQDSCHRNTYGIDMCQTSDGQWHTAECGCWGN